MLNIATVAMSNSNQYDNIKVELLKIVCSRLGVLPILEQKYKWYIFYTLHSEVDANLDKMGRYINSHGTLR